MNSLDGGHVLVIVNNMCRPEMKLVLIYLQLQ